ncbi:MAG TPA: hypothetical protein VH988_15095 [Thermoanaerobaculia bacterium]|nr:hypothetical protein [Thermoanaerobaculia bacterium]
MRARRFLSAIALLGLLGAPAAFAAVVSLGPEFQVNVHPGGSQPSVATGADGRVFMVWSQDGVIGRLYDAGSGRFLSDEIRIAAGSANDPKVLAEPGGGFFVVWEDGAQTIRARRYGADGQPAGPAFLASFDGGDPGTLDVVRTAAGGHLVVSAMATSLPPFQTYLWVDTLDATDQLDPNGRHVVWPGQNGVFVVHPRVAAQSGGGFVLAWEDALPPFNDIWAEHLSPQGLPVDEPFRVNDVAAATRTRPSVVVEDGGGFAVVWRTVGAGPADGVWVQRFDAANARRGDAIRLAVVLDTSDVANVPQTVVNAPRGRRLVLWPDLSPAVDPPGLVGSPLVLGRFFDASWQPVGETFQLNDNRLASGQEAAASFLPGGGFVAAWSSPDIIGHRFSDDCLGGGGSLCLSTDRFLASVAWHDPRSNARGTATALPLTGDTGAFWFFSAGNAELLVKVLDGRPVNGHWWVFFGALTDLEYDLTVTDSRTGLQKVYHNPPYTLASRADINAFSESAATPEPGIPRPLPPDTCPAGACLGAFEVSVEWVDPATGQTHQAAGAPLSGDSAYFWFFDPNNIELIVKVLDGHAVNGHWWMFYGALSNVEYTIRVDRPDQGLSRTYHNAAGHMESRADVQAFP